MRSLNWTDLRRHHRSPTLASGVRVSSTETGKSAALVNFSFGGMLLDLTTPLERGSLHEFRIHLPGAKHPTDSALVKARVRRVDRIGIYTWRIGVEFVDSDREWLRPDTPDQEES
jgi:c-di-GMP-binding flagellar brake protein YcgR